MLKAFRVTNFKNLINILYEPTSVNLLIGPNNAGKTNLCQALYLLGLSSKMAIEDAAAECTSEPWNLLNVYIDDEYLTLAASCGLVLDDEPLSFTYSLSLVGRRGTRDAAKRRTLMVADETLKVSGGKFVDTTLIENKRGQARLLHEGRFLKGLTPGSESEYVETVVSTDSTMLCKLYDLETNRRANLFKRYLASWGYYNLAPGSLRSNRARQMDSVLQSNGENLSSVLLTMHTAFPRAERGLIAAAKRLEPRLDALSFQTPDPDHVYMFFEDKQGNRFGLGNVSDGTLRYLAMWYLVFSSREGFKEIGGSPLIMIEEPENGIFVGNLKGLFESLATPSGDMQVIFTSHNPYFIDLFDSALEGVSLVKPGETHSTLVRPNSAMMQERLGQFSLGELHFRELLE